MSWSEPVIWCPRSRSSPASEAMAVPAMAERWTFKCVLAPLRKTPSRDRGLQDLEPCLLAVADQTRPHTQRQRDVGRGGVAAREAERDRDVEAGQRLADHVLEGERGGGGRVAALHVPEHDPLDPRE